MRWPQSTQVHQRSTYFIPHNMNDVVTKRPWGEKNTVHHLRNNNNMHINYNMPFDRLISRNCTRRHDTRIVHTSITTILYTIQCSTSKLRWIRRGTWDQIFFTYFLANPLLIWCTRFESRCSPLNRT